MIEIPFPDDGSDTCRKIRALAPLLDVKEGPWIAGGSVRRCLVQQYEDNCHDIDLFFNPKTSHKMAYITKVLNFPQKVDEKVILPLFDITVEDLPTHPRIQFVPRPFMNIEDVIDNIDFTVCRFVTDGRVIHCPQIALEHLKGNILSNENQYLVRNRELYLMRILKYISLGYHPTFEAISAATGFQPDYDDIIPKFQTLAASTEYDLDEDDIEPYGTLSIITGCTMVHIKHRDWAFINGLPYPANLAFAIMYSSRNRHYIQGGLRTLWKKLGLEVTYKQLQITLTEKRFVDEYRAFDKLRQENYQLCVQ